MLRNTHRISQVYNTMYHTTVEIGHGPKSTSTEYTTSSCAVAHVADTHNPFARTIHTAPRQHIAKKFLSGAVMCLGYQNSVRGRNSRSCAHSVSVLALSIEFFVELFIIVNKIRLYFKERVKRVLMAQAYGTNGIEDERNTRVSKKCGLTPKQTLWLRTKHSV